MIGKQHGRTPAGRIAGHGRAEVHPLLRSKAGQMPGHGRFPSRPGSDSNVGHMHNGIKTDSYRPILPGIQLLRGLAALLVIAGHTNLMMGNPKNFGISPFPIRDAGVFGVAVFFVISGFIIAHVSLDRNWRPRLGVGDYAWRRFARIVPFMWLCIIGYNIVSYVGTGQMEWAPALRAMVLWPVGELKPNAVWSLQHELFFYILFAIAMLGTRRHMGILIAWFAAPIIYGGAITLLGDAAIPTSPWLAELLRVVLLGGFSGANVQFGMGFALGLLWLRWPAFPRFVLPGGLWITVALLTVATVLVELMAAPIASFGRIIGWSCLAFAVVAVGVFAREGKGLLYDIGIVLGNASFSLYLTHNAIILTLFKIAGMRLEIMPLWLWFFLFVTVTTALGLMTHYLVEAPLINWLARGRMRLPWQRSPA